VDARKAFTALPALEMVYDIDFRRMLLYLQACFSSFTGDHGNEEI
jgi:hypothetical protein